jgi:hypothetical protein
MADRYAPISANTGKLSQSKRMKDAGNETYAEVIAEHSLTIDAGGTSQAVSISTTSAQSAAIPGGSAVIYSTVDCFVRSGANPTALSNGTDRFIPAGIYLRVGFASGEKLAFITAAGTGTVYIAPGA